MVEPQLDVSGSTRGFPDEVPRSSLFASEVPLWSRISTGSISTRMRDRIGSLVCATVHHEHARVRFYDRWMITAALKDGSEPVQWLVAGGQPGLYAGCEDHEDNDLDGLVDCADPDCMAPSAAGICTSQLCPSPLPESWIFCDDFESDGSVGNRYANYFDTAIRRASF